MIRSFQLLNESNSNIKAEDIKVEKFHVNVWMFKPKEIYMEIGLMLSVSESVFSQNENIKLKLLSPFTIGKKPIIENRKIMSLHNKLNNEGMIQLLFNDHFADRTVIKKRDDNTPISDDKKEFTYYYKFVSEYGFILLKPEGLDANDNEISFSFNLNDIKIKEIIEGDQNRSEWIRLYTRFRYKVDNKVISNLYFGGKFLKEEIFYDFRFNDLRITEKQESSRDSNLIDINLVQIFITLPVNYRIVIGENQYMKAVRFLEDDEDGWNKSFDGIYDKINKNKYLVFYWKLTPEDEQGESKKSKNSFKLLTCFEIEKDDIKRELDISTHIGLLSIIISIINVKAVLKVFNIDFTHLSILYKILAILIFPIILFIFLRLLIFLFKLLLEYLKKRFAKINK